MSFLLITRKRSKFIKKHKDFYYKRDSSLLICDHLISHLCLRCIYSAALSTAEVQQVEVSQARGLICSVGLLGHLTARSRSGLMWFRPTFIRAEVWPKVRGGPAKAACMFSQAVSSGGLVVTSWLLMRSAEESTILIPPSVVSVT